MRRCFLLGMCILLLTLVSWSSNPVFAASTPASFLGDPLTRLVHVNGSARVVLTWAELAQAGWNRTSLPLERVQVWREGQQTPIRIDDTGIVFAASGNQSAWSADATYWLVLGASNVSLRDTIGATLVEPYVWERDTLYQSLSRTARGDSWFAGELRSGAAPVTLDLALPAALPAGSHIELALTPYLVRSGHILDLYAGATLVGHIQWNDQAHGPQRQILTTLVALPAGQTQLQVVLASSGSDVVLLDSLTMPELTQVLPTVTPQIDRPSVLAAFQTVDQQIITHASLAPALPPLLDLAASEGRRVGVVDVQAIYNSYSWGERDPEAIRSYLRDLHAAEPSVRSILLMGAGTVRMRVGPAESDPTLIPPYLVPADGVNGIIPCDTCYTRLSSADALTQPVPDLVIGRMPARTLEEAFTLVAKRVAAARDAGGTWRTSMIIVADNDRDALGTPDPAGPFTPLVESLAGDFPTLRADTFQYAPDMTGDAGPTYQHAELLRTDLFRAWDRGAAVIAYVGHANAWQWGFTGPQEPVPHLMVNSDAVRTNRSRLPLLLSVDCLSGAFANPYQPAIDEALVRQPDGGVLASLSPTGSSVNTGHATLFGVVAPALAEGKTLGEAHLVGLQQVGQQSPSSWHLAFSYTILGDPDVRLPQPKAIQVFLPLVTR